MTDAQAGRHFAVTSAHDPASIDWSIFKGIDTLVVLMGGSNLAIIVQSLLGNGWQPKTPVRAIL